MANAYYISEISSFIGEDINAILGKLVTNHPFKLDELQRNAWLGEIEILKRELANFREGYISFEYSIPRMGKRVDVIIIINGFVFIVEFKIGENHYTYSAITQVTDYALDLKDFHVASRNAMLVPIVLSSNAVNHEFKNGFIKSGISSVQKCNKNSLQIIINKSLDSFEADYIDPILWLNSYYRPTPTIIEAAKLLFNRHTVDDISRSDAYSHNLCKTTTVINNIIDNSKLYNKKSICFITGVPGAGKTLAGLKIAVERQNIDLDEHAVFLSGNGPLVNVLQEALARDEQERENIAKGDAKRKAKEFIQLIHHFRDDALTNSNPPIEKVVVFDEAQRAWTSDTLESFMQHKKGMAGFHTSEPEFLISVMDRHRDWATIICLIGGGQEINTGEAGIQEWFKAIKNKFSHWDVFISNKIVDEEYTQGIPLDCLLNGLKYTIIPDLHLCVSLRSYRSENVSYFIKLILDFNLSKARELYHEIIETYQILLTRDIDTAKKWIKSKAKGSERYGIIASSGAKRLKNYGVWVQSKIDAIAWFLNDNNDVRSSYYLEDTATEFDIQGLELDWAIVCWDANLRINQYGFEYHLFKGSKWTNINRLRDRVYLKNSYRVLLTRSRQGFIIFIPNGVIEDKTRQPVFYDGIYNYLKDIGIKEI